MKKKFKSFIIALMAVGMIAMFGCKKDEDNANKLEPRSIANTLWETVLTQDNEEVYLGLTFSGADSAALEVAVPSMGVGVTFYGTYSFDGLEGSISVSDNDHQSVNSAIALKAPNQLQIALPIDSTGTSFMPVVLTETVRQ